MMCMTVVVEVICWTVPMYKTACYGKKEYVPISSILIYTGFVVSSLFTR